MATVDGSGYNTSALFQAKNYDPTALATGLQSAATYDPTQQSTSNPSSAVQYQQSLNSPNTAYQDGASSTQNSSSPNLSTPHTAASAGLTAASNNAPYASYRSNLVTAPTTQSGSAANSNTGVSTVSNVPTSVNGTAGPSTAGSGAAYSTPAKATGATTAIVGTTPITYDGPAIVQVGQNYYQFNPATGGYVFAGAHGYTYDSSYRITGDTYGSLTNAQAASATQFNLDPKNSMNQGQVLSLINQQPAVAASIAGYQKQIAAAQANTQATNSAAATTTQYNNTLNYLTTHNGQLSPQDAAVLGNTYAGSGAALSQAQQAAITKAQTDYAAQKAHANLLGGINIAPVDTSAVDATNQAAMNSLISQYATGNTATGAGYGAAQNASALGGQNLLSHNTAAATSYDTNLSNFQTALNNQYSADKSATGNQLYNDIQGVQQIVAQLEQEMGQLSTAARTKAQAQIDQLNQYVNQYQQSVAQYGQGSQQAMTIAGSILSAGGTLAAGV